MLEHLEPSTPHINGFRTLNSDEGWAYVLPFSAKTKTGLLGRVRSLTQRQYQGQILNDLSYTLGCRRSFFPQRGCIVAQPDSIDEDLQEEKLIHISEQSDLKQWPIAMIFTGQGAQWPQMGLGLIDKHATFRSTIRSLDARLQGLKEAPTWTIEQTIREDPATSQLSDPWRSQSVCTAVQIALVNLFRTWGVVAETVVGHSSGEIAAAYAAGHITSGEAMAIAYYRGLVAARCTFRGAMMAVGLGEQDADAEINSANLRNEVRVACKNSPENSTLSGTEEAIERLHWSLTSRKIFARKLRTSGVAYHSYHMANLGPEYEELLSMYLNEDKGVKNDAPTPRMVSTVTGRHVDIVQVSQPQYWRANLESPVEFSKAISTINEAGAYHFLEVGPHSALELPLKQIAAQGSGKLPLRYVSAMIRNADSMRTALGAISHLFICGHDIDFKRVNAIPDNSGIISHVQSGKVLTDLPQYPWQHDTVLWNESRASTEYRFRKHTRHDLLGSIVPGGSPRSSTWRNLLRLKEVPWLADHQLDGSIIFPAAGYLAMAVEALIRMSDELLSLSAIAFRSVHFTNALVLPVDSHAHVELVTDLRPCTLSRTTDSKTWYYFEISSIAERGATLHATGSISIGRRLTAWDRCLESLDIALETVNPKRWYERFAVQGLQYGPHFQPIRAMYFRKGRSGRFLRSDIQAINGIESKQVHQEPQYMLHPSIIDALLQTGLMADSCGDITRLRAGIPVSIEKFVLQLPSVDMLERQLVVDATAIPAGPSTLLLDCKLRDKERNLVASMHGVRVTEYVAAAAQVQQSGQILDLIWKPDIDWLTESSYSAFLNYIITGTNPLPAIHTGDITKQLIGFLDLFLHKRPGSRILQLETPSSSKGAFGRAIHAVAQYGTSYQRCKTIEQGTLGADGSITISDSLTRTDQELQEKFDIIVSCEVR